MADDLTTNLETAAGKPRKIVGENGESVEQHSLPDLVGADRHVRAVAATKATSPRLLINKLVPPGA